MLMVCVLCFGIKAQAQSLSVTEIDKTFNMSQSGGDVLEQLLFGGPSSIYVNNQGEVKIFQRNNEPISALYINGANDFDKLAEAYREHLGTIQVLNIKWDGKYTLQPTAEVLQLMQSLQYVYFQSYDKLTENDIRSNFRNFLANLENRGNVTVLYKTIDQPQ